MFGVRSTLGAVQLRSLIAGLVAGCGLALLAACASYGPGDLRVGDAEAAVVQSMGPPAARYPLPGGALRLAYARGPFGKHTWMVDLGPDGRVTRWRQVLTEAQFAELQLGTPADEVLLTLGPPARVRPRGLRPGELWSYRYETYECRWFQVVLDEEHKVAEAGYGVDPMCEVGKDDWTN